MTSMLSQILLPTKNIQYKKRLLVKGALLITIIAGAFVL